MRSISVSSPGEGGEDGWRGLLPSPLHRLDQASLLRFHADEGGHDGAHAQCLDLAAEDASQQRTGNSAGDFIAKMPADKARDRFVFAIAGADALTLPRVGARANKLVGPAS